MSVHVHSLTLADLAEAHSHAASTDHAETLVVDTTRQLVVVLPSGRITVLDSGSMGR